ncbi:MAG: hypothetical protein JXB29_06075 [Sedimentisphaerales bacterium]|nr:hypothetical protein [Sedimentisphaerales bacterium]
MQADYGKKITSPKKQQTVDCPAERIGLDISKLFAVVITAEMAVKGAQKINRYYARLSSKRLNALRDALEALRATEI